MANDKTTAIINSRRLTSRGVIQFPTTNAFFCPVSVEELRHAVREGCYIYCNDIQNNNTDSGIYYLKNADCLEDGRGTEIYAGRDKCVYNPQSEPGLRNQQSGSIYDTHILYSDGDQNIWYYNRATQKAKMIWDKFPSTFEKEEKFRDPGFFADGKFILAGDDRFLVFNYTEEGASFSHEYNLELLRPEVIYAECPYVKDGRIYFSGNGCDEPARIRSCGGQDVKILRTTGLYSVAYNDEGLSDLRRENISPDLYTNDGKGFYWIGNWNYNDEISYAGYTGDYFNSLYIPQETEAFAEAAAKAKEDFIINADCEIIFKGGLQFNMDIKSGGKTLRVKDSIISRDDLDNDDYQKKIFYVGIRSMIITKKYVVFYPEDNGAEAAWSDDPLVKSPVEPCLIVFKLLDTHDLKLTIPFDTEFYLRKIAPQEVSIEALKCDCRAA